MTDLSDEALVEALENRTLPEAQFRHEAHMRAAWHYLRHYDEAEAIERCSRAIRAYATGLGAARIFHVTITEALMRLIAVRMAGAANRDSRDEFTTLCADLFADAYGVLLTYYDRDTLASERARTQFVAPSRPFE
jgi:hypothetical protein